MKNMELRRLVLVAIVCGFLMLGGTSQGQEFSSAFGVSTVTAPSASSASAFYSPQSMTGGAYLNFSSDFLIKNRFGVNAELSWRASRDFYQGLYPFRPIFYDFNGIWAPKLGKSATAELMAGIGGVDIRFYQPFTICGAFGCTDYVSSNHFLGHFGGGLRLYLHGGLFVRPEAHLYLIRNNVEFSSGRAARYGVSLGYTFGHQ
jgi:hypothetical protein